MKNISVYFSTLFGIGYFPKIPGTIGTLFAAIVFFALPDNWLSGNGLFYFLPIFLIFIFLSILLTSQAEKKLGKDDPKIILDEFVGYFIAMILLPKTMVFMFSAFVIFRIFDILKPEPVNVLQKLPQGWGIVLDDVMAGIYTNIILQVVNLLG